MTSSVGLPLGLFVLACLHVEVVCVHITATTISPFSLSITVTVVKDMLAKLSASGNSQLRATSSPRLAPRGRRPRDDGTLLQLYP